MTSIYVNGNSNGTIGEKNNGGLITVSQVAELLHVHPHSIRRWATPLLQVRFAGRQEIRT